MAISFSVNSWNEERELQSFTVERVYYIPELQLKHFQETHWTTATHNKLNFMYHEMLLLFAFQLIKQICTCNTHI